MPDQPLSFYKRFKKSYFLIIIYLGRLLKKLMWRMVEFRNNGRRVHPKHIALPNEHHHWYAADIEEGWRVCDLGCDRGGHVKTILRAKAFVTGVEKNRDALKQAYKSGMTSYIQADLEKPIPIKGGSFDAVLALDVIEHLYARDRFIFEIARILKPGGLVFLSAPNRATAWKKTARELGLFEFSDPDHKIEYEKDELIRVVENHGLELISLAPVVFDTPFDNWIDFLGGISNRLYLMAWTGKREKAIDKPWESTGFRILLRKNEQMSGENRLKKTGGRDD